MGPLIYAQYDTNSKQEQTASLQEMEMFLKLFEVMLCGKYKKPE